MSSNCIERTAIEVVVQMDAADQPWKEHHCRHIELG